MAWPIVMICLMNVCVTSILILKCARICFNTMTIEIHGTVFQTILPLLSQGGLGVVLFHVEQSSMILFLQYHVMVDQSAEILATNVNVRTHRYFATTPAIPTFLWAIVIVTELKIQLNNTSTSLTVLEDLTKCFAQNVSNAMPLANSASTFCMYVMENQTVMITPMKVIAPLLQIYLVFFRLTPK